MTNHTAQSLMRLGNRLFREKNTIGRSLSNYAKAWLTEREAQNEATVELQRMNYELRLEVQSLSETCIKVAGERTALAAMVERQREFLAQVAKQIAEKPDYWSSCGQCERNSSDAEDLIELTPATALRLHDAGVLERVAEEFGESLNIHDQYAAQGLRRRAARLRAGGEG